MVRNLSKKGISPVIATILLLAITVIIAVGVYQFLNTYTQDTFDNVSGDATIDLAFANRVSMFLSDGGNNVTMNIARTTFPETLTFDQIIFQGPDSLSVDCNFEFNVTAGTSNSLPFERVGDSRCNYSNSGGANRFETGQYNILMIGDTTVRVDAVDFR